ncbi:MAG: cupin domain-containing protein [Terriglobia bacterium]
MTTSGKTEARVVRLEELPWIEPPGHHGALSKLLVNPDNTQTSSFDFRISIYEPRGHVEPHTHSDAEQVYYILEGKGLMRLGDRDLVVEPNTAIHIPSGLIHGIANTGLEDLVFIVVTTPPQISRSDS